MVVTLGYWDIRGLAHAIRLLLEYTETPYQERRYRPGPAPDFDISDWTNEKEKLGLDFPNLPYLIDGPTKLTQSNAILRYIARKHGMGEAEGGVPGAAAREAAGPVAVPGLPALVCGAEAHLRGLCGIRRSGPVPHVRAPVPRAGGEPGAVPAVLRGSGEDLCLHALGALHEDPHFLVQGEVEQHQGVRGGVVPSCTPTPPHSPPLPYRINRGGGGCPLS
ncbi:uncharacterized protein LOC115599720 isoform X2 [Calypte anna]|uniref:uncharacterized protein LOC115599720 isoform X2 n=1 Tax=Calypte anna TaxID=9244 RepID=UPI0011C4358C|nr:uncharacterized protein LOC115599720 isoform X2 [Calypte anna]